jgi:hypothetical protein
MEPESPLVAPHTPEVSADSAVPLWRNALWAGFIFMVVYPLAWLAGVFAVQFLFSLHLLPQAWLAHEDFVAFVVPSVVALLPVWRVIRTGLRRKLPGRRSQLAGWGIAATGMAIVFALGAVATAKVRTSSNLKAMIPRQPSAAIDQFYVENPYRIFLKYDELVGPERYFRTYHSADDADISWQFPVRQGCGESLPVRLPDGTTVRRIEVIAAVGQSGLVATFPLPQDDQYDPKRVYRLDNGVTFRDWRVVNRPPDPAGREGRDQDGVHVYQLSGGRRFEVTYRGGVPDGPFRAFHGDGALWGEATYRNGRVVEAWLFTRDGRKFDELKDGEAAQKAVSDSLAATSPGTR